MHKNNELCEECFSKFKPTFFHYKIDNFNAISIYPYDEVIRELIYKYKGCFDIELKSVFTSRFLLYLRLKYFGYIIVPVPSYYLDDKTRGFNHVVEIAKLLKLPIVSCLEKTEKIKQANLKSAERKQIGKVLKINDITLIKNKKILLFDDICTTGSSLKASIKLIMKGRPKKIEILTIAKNIKTNT